jgi:predicted RNA-binding Zn-ribbon protein involved in translation (DUF1610 family)
MRKILTARDQFDMLSPWRTAGEVEGYPRHYDKTVWTPEQEGMAAELGERLQQKGVSGLNADSVTKALQELILMQREKEESSSSEDYDKNYNDWEAGYENGDYDEKTARRIVARAFEKISAPPGFDKVYGPNGEFLRSDRPESYPRLKERVVEEPAPPVKKTKPAPPMNYFTNEPDPGLAPGKQQMIPEMKDTKRERPVLAPKGEVPMAATVESPEAVKGEKVKRPKQMTLPGFSQNLARFLLPDEMEKSIIEKYNAADEGTKAAGMDWYDTANEYINFLGKKTGRDPRQVGAIMSAFSPQTAWDANMAAATHFIMNYDPRNPNALDDKMGGLGENLERAKRIHAAGDEEGWLAGLQNGNDAHKITNFYHNLMGDRDKVTIDSWMARALLGKGSDGLADKTVQKVLGWKEGYDTMAGAVQSAAKKLGITPRELQATVWSHVVPTAGSYSEPTMDEFRRMRKQQEKYLQSRPEDSKIVPKYDEPWREQVRREDGSQPSPDRSFTFQNMPDPQQLYDENIYPRKSGSREAQKMNRFWNRTAEYDNRIDRDRTPVKGECPGSGVRMVWRNFGNRPESDPYPACAECGKPGLDMDHAFRAKSH